MKIYAPNKRANGVYASVRFVDGVGETNKPHLIEWFKRNGYTVEGEFVQDISVLNKIEEVVESVKEEPVVEMMGYSEPSFEGMTPNELRDWMKANGLGREMKNIRNKEKLIEIIKAKKG
jgi:hypothetical protein